MPSQPRRKAPVKPGEKILRAVRPNQGIQAAYRRKLVDLIEEMGTSIEHWLGAAYKRNEPLVKELAADAAPIEFGAVYLGGKRPWGATLAGEPLLTAQGNPIRFMSAETATAAARRLAERQLPAEELTAVMNDLAGYWQDRFDQASEGMADYFARSAARRTDAQMRRVLRQGGISVRFQPTPAVRDVLQATISENVSLIRSIPKQYLTQVEGMVMRSVQRGRDLSSLSDELQSQLGVSKRRAAVIARDQNNKATAVIQETRRKELGIKRAIWMHSGGGKKPRPTHVAMSGKTYDVDKGMYDSAEGRYVLPGELINCRCVSRSIIPGFGD